ncbi:ATP-binding protein [Defluviitalea phaphyphila]|uniref:ATP-binding protein n=1 Tax=Defluviitalea phaphyphila TaxID=1473580 RepID=UPI00072FB716|nr:ATP-binding protein [Defluviitalea phaphyphila]
MELTVISGKGGTGKTTIALSLSELAKDVAKADCDVDAPNLYLFHKGIDIKKEVFYGEKKAVINKEICNGCKTCENICRFDAIENGIINSFKCEGCGACVLVCPQNAITLEDYKTANTYITKTKKGVISRADMEIGAEGSGKLITKLRQNIREVTEDNTLIIIDGSPGIGCPVISSITGSDAVLIVTEPTQSGMEDFIRVMELCNHFGILTLVCINKYDINKVMSENIEKFCEENHVHLVGKIPYDDTVIKSINELKPIIYYENSMANKAIRSMWENIKEHINQIKNNF